MGEGHFRLVVEPTKVRTDARSACAGQPGGLSWRACGFDNGAPKVGDGSTRIIVGRVRGGGMHMVYVFSHIRLG